MVFLQLIGISLALILICWEQNWLSSPSYFSSYSNKSSHIVKKSHPINLIPSKTNQIDSLKTITSSSSSSISVINERKQSLTANRKAFSCPFELAHIEYPYFCTLGIMLAVLFLGNYNPQIDFFTEAPDTRILVFFDTNVKFQIPTTISLLTNLLMFGCWSSVIGEMPSEFGLLTTLEYLSLFQNWELTGSIPSEMGRLTRSVYFLFSESDISGTVPSELSLLTSLSVLNMARLNIYPVLSSEIGLKRNLTKFLIDETYASGTLPTEIGILPIDKFAIYVNQISGTVPTQIGKWVDVTEIWLDQNRFSGTIPTELGNLKKMTSLHMHRNFFSGSIPSELGQLTGFKTMRFDSNHLTGTLPSELGLIENIYFNISENQLSGTIPIEIRNNKNFNISCDYSGLIDSKCAFRAISNNSVEFLDIRIFITVMVLITLLMISIIICACLTYKYRSNKVIKSTNYRFGIFSLAGLLILSSSVVPFGITLIKEASISQRDSACALFPHFLAHGLVIVMSCIIVRNYPIWRVFDNPKLVVVTIQPSQLIKAVFIALLVDICFVIPLSVDLKANISHFGCSTGQTTSYLLIVVCGYIFFLGLVACWMCWKIRKIAPRFYNNTKDIAKSTYNLFTFGLAMSVIGLVSTNATTLFIAIFFAVTVSVSTFTVLVHVKKLKKAIFPKPADIAKAQNYFPSKSGESAKFSGPSTGNKEK